MHPLKQHAACRVTDISSEEERNTSALDERHDNTQLLETPICGRFATFLPNHLTKISSRLTVQSIFYSRFHDPRKITQLKSERQWSMYDFQCFARGDIAVFTAFYIAFYARVA